MRRILSLMGRLPWRGISFRHVTLLIFLGALALLGIRGSHNPGSAPVKDPAQKPETKPNLYMVAFSKLRPRAGDHMVLPRIGFRWNFAVKQDSGDVSQASFMPSFLSGADSLRAVGTQAIRFLLHLVGPGGKPEIVRETTSSELHLDLKDRFPAGEYEWWVEAMLPGQPPIRSTKEKFVLQP